MSRRNKTQDNQPMILTADAYSNPMFRLGLGTQAPLEAVEYPLTRLTDNYAKLNSMYRSGGILQSIVDIIPEDMTREWFRLQGDIKPEDINAFEKAQRKIGLKRQVIEGLRWGRLYGGAAGLILIKGQENFEKPLNIEAILPDTFAGLWILDRWSGVFPGQELVTDIMDKDYGLPKFYEIRTEEQGKIIAKVHHSRIVRFTGRELPYLEKIAEMYWGESEIEPIYEDIALYDSVMANMGNLTFQANVDTMEVQNLDQLFAIGSVEQQKRFWSVMQAQSVAKSNFGYRLINKGDSISNQQYSFTGFDTVTQAVQMNLSAKTHIPVTKLFGQAPAGLNATGESDMKNYYDVVDGQRESKLRPILERILPVLCMSVWGKVPDDIEITFPPLWTPNATELAQIAATKSQSIIGAFQSGLLNMGPAQAELKKLEDETGMFGSIEDKSIEENKDKTFQELQQMDDPMAGLFDSPKEEEEGSNEENPFLTKDDFDPDQPRDDEGKWTKGAGATKKYECERIRPKDWFPDKTPNSHKVFDKDKEYIDLDGTRYVVDGSAVIFSPTENERRVANILESQIGGELFLLPKVNRPDNVKMGDYLFNGKKYDLKTITGSGKNTLDSAIKKKKGQAPGFIFDLSNCPLSKKQVRAQVKEIFKSKHRIFIDEIIIIRGNKIKEIYRRKK